MKLYIHTLTALARLTDKERGATMPEYGLMVALIAAVAFVGAEAIGASVLATFNDVAATIN